MMSLHRSHFERLLREQAVYMLMLIAATRASDGYDQVTHTSDRSHPDVGGPQLRATLNHCPRVTLEVTPLLAYTFQRVRVHSMSFDPEGDSLSYEWTARPDGTFASPQAILTDYRCGSKGRKELAVRVTDARGCASTRKSEVTCVGAAHGANGLHIVP